MAKTTKRANSGLWHQSVRPSPQVQRIWGHTPNAANIIGRADARAQMLRQQPKVDHGRIYSILKTSQLARENGAVVERRMAVLQNAGIAKQTGLPRSLANMAGAVVRNPGKAILGAAVAYGAAKMLAPTAARAEDSKAAASSTAPAKSDGSTARDGIMHLGGIAGIAVGALSAAGPRVGLAAKTARIAMGGMTGIFGSALATMHMEPKSSKSEGVTGKERAIALGTGATFTASGVMMANSLVAGVMQRASRRPSVGSLVSGAILGMAQVGMGAPIMAAAVLAKGKDAGGPSKPKAFLDDTARARTEANAASPAAKAGGQSNVAPAPAYQDSWADKNGKRYTRRDMSVRTAK